MCCCLVCCRHWSRHVCLCTRLELEVLSAICYLKLWLLLLLLLKL